MEQLVLAPEQRRQTVLDLLDSARRSVILSLFRCDDSRVLDRIVATARRGTDVRVLVTPRARGWTKRLGSLVMLLKDTGDDVHQYDGPWSKYHAKYIVVDGETAAVGSMNLTRKCFDETCDFVLVTNQPDIVSGLMRLYEADRYTPGEPTPRLSERLIVGPENSRARMLGLLESAARSIRIIDHRLSHPEILLTIARKSKDGVRVEIRGRGEVAEFVSHGKLILIDDRIAVVGSASLSRAGLDVRREVSVVIDDPEKIAGLTDFFERISAAPLSGNLEVVEDEDED